MKEALITIPLQGEGDSEVEHVVDMLAKLFPEEYESGKLGEVAQDELDHEKGEYRVKLVRLH